MRRSTGGSVRRRALAAVALVAVAALAAAPEPAAANTYSVRSCWAGYAGSGGWAPNSNGGTQLTVYDACGNGSAGMGVTSNAGPAAWLWQYGQWVFNAPGGAWITGYHADVQLTNGSGWVAKLVDTDNNHVLFCGGAAYNCSWLPWWHEDIAVNSSQVRLLLQCAQNACLTPSAGVGAFAQRNVTIDINDPDGAGINAYAGGLTGGWQRGTQSISYNSWDPQSGVAHTWAEVDHARSVADVTHGCDDRNVHICPDGGAGGSIDTASLSEGIHTLYAYAVNGAGMQSGGSVGTFGVDNTAPDAPLAVTVEEGSGWRSSPNFKVDESIPGSTAPIVSGEMQLCKLDDTSCQTLTASTSGVTSVAAPSAGEWKSRFRYSDAAGNIGAWSAWSGAMRYDPAAPQGAQPRQANGWINKTEINDYYVRLALGATPGPSGIAGYAVTTDGSMPDTTITNPTDPDSTQATFPLAELPEGETTVRARAISGAGVPAPNELVGESQVRVDLTAPIATATGAPAGSGTAAGSSWQGEPVALTFTGTDQPTLSGMAGGPASRPVEEGAYMEYRVDGADWTKVRGDTATLTEGDTGDHVIDYRAVDLAGNPSDTRSLRVKVDVVRPGATTVHGTDWRNATTFLEELVLADPGAIGPSGLRGFAVTTDGGLPGTTTASTAANGVMRVNDLQEGVTTIRARAISTAGRAAPDSDVGTAEIKVDRTAPNVSVSGQPANAAAWQARPVALTFTAHDQQGLSGVSFLAYALDAAAERHVDGAGESEATAALDVAGDGAHTVTYWAVDRAGNASTPKSVSFRVEQNAPLGGLLPPDPADPTQVAFYVSSPCIQSARIEIRPQGGEWKALDTQLSGDRITAHIPDQAYAQGNYEIRAVVVDCAGNQAVLNQWWEGSRAGEAAVLHLPLRIATVLKASFGTKTSAASKSACRMVTRAKVIRTRTGKKRVRRFKVRVCPKPAKRKTRRGKQDANKAQAFSSKAKKKRASVRRRAASGTAAVGLGAPRPVTGTLTTIDGKPIAGAPVEVQVQIKGRSDWSTVAHGVTNANGAMTATAPAGPSRKVRLSYAGTGILLTAESSPLTAPVAASSTIRASRTTVRNGQSVTFTGRLLGGYLPAGGRELELNGYNPARHKWVPVQTKGLHTGSAGRWTARYKFTATVTRTLYRFRLRISALPGFPFEEGYSPTVNVRVLP